MRSYIPFGLSAGLSQGTAPMHHLREELYSHIQEHLLNQLTPRQPQQHQLYHFLSWRLESKQYKEMLKAVNSITITPNKWPYPN